jgi:dihydropteroate synthase
MVEGARGSDASHPRIQLGIFELSLARPLVMGVVNVTPDSFSDGGRFLSPKVALAHARGLIDDGADMLDVGGESSRPGAQAVSEDDELRRVLPVIEGLSGCGVPLSIDTRRARVMREALAAGASMVNDIQALRGEGALAAVAASRCAVCLMHMQGEPATMQRAPEYRDVVAEVKAFLGARAAAAEAAGIARERIVIDPGFGFGKTPAHNLTLLHRLNEFAELGLPVLAGLSRKSTLGTVTGRPVEQRLAASLAAALLAAQGGAKILRVHDVRETRDMLALWQAVREAGEGGR